VLCTRYIRTGCYVHESRCNHNFWNHTVYFNVVNTAITPINRCAPTHASRLLRCAMRRCMLTVAHNVLVKIRRNSYDIFWLVAAALQTRNTCYTTICMFSYFACARLQQLCSVSRHLFCTWHLHILYIYIYISYLLYIIIIDDNNSPNSQ